MNVALKESRLGLRNSTTRLPFRYGAATLSRCPQAILEVTVEAGGRIRRGWSGDCLPPGWFDKAPGKGYRQQIDEMRRVIDLARSAFLDASRAPRSLFATWREADEAVRRDAESRGFNPLLASFGVSMVERAIIDALCRAAGVGLAEAVRSGLFGIEPAAVHPELSGSRPADWLPAEPLRSVFVRHTVGMADPLTGGEIGPEDRVGDGLPQALEEYVERCGLRYFKVKLAADPDRDRDRLIAFAEVVERHRGPDYRLTIDGNEQFKEAAALDAFFASLRGDPRLRQLMENVVAIEQPLARSIALEPEHTEGIEALSAWRPVIIDESDGEPDSYRRALGLGYRGVSSKNCKGPIKAILNAGLTWLRNDRGRRADFLMTGEDLCSVGIVPVQSDLCLAATLGLDHVERNGHHYHPGLSYLPESQRRAALAAHPDFYAEHGGIIGPSVRDGRFAVGSLHCVGYGFAVEPEMDAYSPAERWSYDSLGLGD